MSIDVNFTFEILTEISSLILSVLNMASGTIFTTLQFPGTYIIRMDPISYIKLSYSPARGKCSSLLGPFLSSEENYVFVIQPLEPHSQDLIFF